MAIYVTGDTHGADKFSPFGVDGFVNRLNMESFPEQKFMTKDDYVVILGDFGGVWDYRGESKKEKHDLDWLDSRNFTTLFVPGNHENYDRLTGITDEKLLDTWIFKGVSEEEKEKIKTGYPQKAWNGGVVRELRPSVLMHGTWLCHLTLTAANAFASRARSHDISGGILHLLTLIQKRMQKMRQYAGSTRDVHIV